MTLKAINTPASTKKKFSLADVKSGRLQVPQRVLAFGGEKVGKSTFASGAPGVVFLCPENGTPHLDIDRLPTPESWDEIPEILELVNERPEWKTIVIDPVNWLEDLAWAKVVGEPGGRVTDATRDKIEKHGGGFKKGYDAASGLWRSLTKYLELAHYNKGRNIVFCAHAFVKNFRDPSGVEYERYQVQMHEKAAGVLKQWVDDVLFLRHEVLAKQEGAKTVAIATGDRIIHTTWSKAWDAGNRSALPEELPMSWSSYWEAVLAGRNRLAAVNEQIASMLAQIGNPTVTAKANAAVAEARGNVDRLTEIANKLQLRLNQTASKESAST